MKSHRLFILLALAVFTVAGARADETSSTNLLDRWFEAQKDLKSWNADFTQTRRFKTLRQPLTATGHIWFEAPSRFRWQIDKPSSTFALKQNNTLYVVYPKLKRAECYVFDDSTPAEWREALSMMEAGFPRDRKTLESQFAVEKITQTNGVFEISLIPKSAFVKKLMTRIRLGLNSADWSLTLTELEFVDGSSMRNDFEHSRRDEALADDLFQWKAPGDYTVTRPFAKQ